MRIRAQQRRGYQPLLRLLSGSRKAIGLTQEELAEKLGEGWLKSTVQKVESGQRRVDFHEFVAWIQACEGDPLAALKAYLKESASSTAETAGKWPMEVHEAALHERGEQALEHIEQAASLLKKDRRKGPRKK